MTDYKVNFKDLKAKVGIDDVAYALGYRLDRKAGVGRYMELVLGDGREKRDTLIVCHPQDKASQRFFRRDGSKGDVVTLIRENLNAFNVSGKDEWQKIAKVLSRFANMPEPEYREDREYVQSVRYHATFDSSRYEVKPINPDKVPAIFQQRGLSDETVRTFAPFIRLIRDRKNENFDGFNIGFNLGAAAGDAAGGPAGGGVEALQLAAAVVHVGRRRVDVHVAAQRVHHPHRVTAPARGVDQPLGRVELASAQPATQPVHHPPSGETPRKVRPNTTAGLFFAHPEKPWHRRFVIGAKSPKPA